MKNISSEDAAQPSHRVSRSPSRPPQLPAVHLSCFRITTGIAWKSYRTTSRGQRTIRPSSNSGKREGRYPQLPDSSSHSIMRPLNKSTLTERSTTTAQSSLLREKVNLSGQTSCQIPRILFFLLAQAPRFGIGKTLPPVFVDHLCHVFPSEGFYANGRNLIKIEKDHLYSTLDCDRV